VQDVIRMLVILKPEQAIESSLLLCWQHENCIQNCCPKPEGKRPLGRPRRKGEDKVVPVL
jgi:hypothetical protein